MSEKYLICNLCKKRIELKPSISVDTVEKEWWLEKDSKSYWRNKDSGKIFCDSCFNKVFLELEFCGQVA